MKRKILQYKQINIFLIIISNKVQDFLNYHHTGTMRILQCFLA
jgi:hypothetical protein